MWALALWTPLLPPPADPWPPIQLCSCIFLGQRLFAYNRCTEREKKRYLDFLSWKQQIFLFLGYNCIIIMYLGRAFHLRISLRLSSYKVNKAVRIFKPEASNFLSVKIKGNTYHKSFPKHQRSFLRSVLQRILLRVSSFGERRSLQPLSLVLRM